MSLSIQNIFPTYNFGMMQGMINGGTCFNLSNMFMFQSFGCQSATFSTTSCPMFNYSLPAFDMYHTSCAFTMPLSTSSKKSSDKVSSNSSAVKHWTKMTNEEMQKVYGNYAKRIDTKYDGSVDKLNKYLKDKGVLKGKGQAFIDAQTKYGINAAVLIAICMNESAKGSSNLARNKNNVGGIRQPGSKDFRNFNTVDECIDYMAKLLKNNYVNEGLVALYQINAKYCPASETSGNSSWAKNVNSYVEQLA